MSRKCEKTLSTKMPETPGVYLFECEESGRGEGKERLVITRESNLLFVHCPYLGKLALADFHNGLTKPKWAKL